MIGNVSPLNTVSLEANTKAGLIGVQNFFLEDKSEWIMMILEWKNLKSISEPLPRL